MQTPTDVYTCATRHFNASPERVFDAWLDADMVEKWFAPGLGEMTHISIDAHVGGSFSFVQRRDGVDLDHHGRYLEIVRPHRLVFTWGVGAQETSSRVMIDIVQRAHDTELTLTHEISAEWADYVERVTASWTQMLGAMAAALD